MSGVPIPGLLREGNLAGWKGWAGQRLYTLFLLGKSWRKHVTMSVPMQGQQYSRRELSAMLAEVGFVDVEVIPTMGYWNIVPGSKP